MITPLQNTLSIITSKLKNWWELFITNLPNLAIATIVLLISFFLSRFIYKTTLKLLYKKVKQNAVTKLIARLTASVVVLAGLFLALSALNLGKSITGLLTGVGISGIIIGLALQGTLSNTIAGIVLSFRKNIKLGNWIETNSFSGEVVDIALSYLVLKEADNNMVIIPNKMVMENPFKNYSLTTKMRVVINCGVGYESDLDEVKKITKNVISKLYNQKEINEEIEFYYTEFGSSSINFISRFWVNGQSSLEILKAKSKVIIELKKSFDKHNINIPFPIRTININNN
ncbi:mechanosensitive ion channel family protein [Lutibacter sp. TH_r2]|uniref:mechanosensitive ion channel family protein n=1 Tax=Lutibacter sp. TH_r2 TaxID=3082083 RepID=UPI002955D166|nr:mechanosensitive ion channel family protein [Lutibacter sp. TH_r2]MDV7186132.1 mechanosensitive ion channel family protein [Lutibacter sp. TH_r2]